MSLKSLQDVLTSLEAQSQPPEQKQLQRLVHSWAEAVGPSVAAQTRPLSIQRGVLRVATSSSAWAQNLVFERQRILEKLNTQLSMTLTDIRFSTAQWQEARSVSSYGLQQQAQLWQEHPSRLAATDRPQDPQLAEKPTNPNQAFQRWAASLQSRLRDLALCPQCQCPTPSGELDRWSVCGHCAAKQW